MWKKQSPYHNWSDIAFAVGGMGVKKRGQPDEMGVCVTARSSDEEGAIRRDSACVCVYVLHCPPSPPGQMQTINDRPSRGR